MVPEVDWQVKFRILLSNGIIINYISNFYVIFNEISKRNININCRNIFDNMLNLCDNMHCFQN